MSAAKEARTHAAGEALFIVLVLLIVPGRFFYLGVVGILVLGLWLERKRGGTTSRFGLGPANRKWRASVAGVLLGAAMFAVWWICAPLVERMTGTPTDLSVYASALRGRPGALMVLLLSAWTLTAFGEELVFRRFLLGSVERVLHPLPGRTAIAIICSTAAFAYVHSYQGATGVVMSGLAGLTLAVAYLLSRRNLWLVAIAHGAVDTISLVLLYSGQL